MRYYYLYGVRFRGDNVAFLRYLGVKIGARCLISTTIHNFGTEPWLIEIGNDVSITSGVVFLTHDGSSRLFRKEFSEMNAKYGNRFDVIRINNNSFVGVNAIIMPGVTIGPDAVVGSGSVVTKNVPAGSVVVGSPARIISTLDEYIERYRQKSIPVEALDRSTLRRELTRRFWGEER
jgi:acetyltransferase-like isoleucine patch superfamily enzyme